MKAFGFYCVSSTSKRNTNYCLIKQNFFGTLRKTKYSLFGSYIKLFWKQNCTDFCMLKKVAKAQKVLISHFRPIFKKMHRVILCMCLKMRPNWKYRLRQSRLLNAGPVARRGVGGRHVPPPINARAPHF